MAISARGLAVDEISAVNLDARIEHAIFRTARARAFLEQFPPLATAPTDLLPPVSWTQIERQLCSLAGADSERASWEIEVLKACARTEPAELFYRELLSLAWSLIDGTRPWPTPEGDMD
jgi:hypothetical protein